MAIRRKGSLLHGEADLEPLTKAAAQEARAQGIRAAVAGGYAMRFYGSTRLTADVDFVAADEFPEDPPEWEHQQMLSFGGHSYIVYGIPLDWIVRADEYSALYDEAVESAETTEDRYRIVTPEHLAAMKFATRRRKDEGDVIFLLQEPGLVDREKLEDVVYRLVGGRFALDELRSLFREADWRERE